MKLLKRGMIALASMLLASCSALDSFMSSSSSPTPFDGVNDNAVAAAYLAETIKTKDLYGAWAISEDDPIDFLYLIVLLPNHSGLNFMTIDEKNGQPESQYSQYYTWEFNEKDKVFTSHSFKRNSIENGQPEVVEEINETESFDIKLYMTGNEILAMRFNAPGQQYTFLRMDDETYQKLVKDVPGIPRIK